MEGTNLVKNRPVGLSEQELEKFLFAEVFPLPGLALVSFSPMHVDRLVTFYRATLQTRRTFVVDLYGAFVMHLISGQAKVPRPTRDARIRVYYNIAAQKTAPQKILNLFRSDRIELDEILAEPNNYVMLFRPSMARLDFNGQLPANARCFYSYWRGYLEKPEWQQCQRQLREAGGELIEAHTSGHIFAGDTVKFVNALKPKCIMPIHTSAPDEFARYFDNVLLANDGEPITLGV